MAVNEKMAAEYIEKLQSGADPEEVERPAMRFIEKIQAKHEQERFINAKDEAEAHAREGKRELIPDLELRYQDLEKDREIEK